MRTYHAYDRTGILLANRGRTHGDFTVQSNVSQELKRIIHKGINWDSLTDAQQEALEMIVHKIARILSGDPTCEDHWVDIQGYAQLVIDRLSDVSEE